MNGLIGILNTIQICIRRINFSDWSIGWQGRTIESYLWIRSIQVGWKYPCWIIFRLIQSFVQVRHAPYRVNSNFRYWKKSNIGHVQFYSSGVRFEFWIVSRIYQNHSLYSTGCVEEFYTVQRNIVMAVANIIPVMSGTSISSIIIIDYFTTVFFNPAFRSRSKSMGLKESFKSKVIIYGASDQIRLQVRLTRDAREAV